MDKYIGNKKAILEGIEKFLIAKNIESGLFIDVFSGTTNVGQYFKQRGYSIISNDINDFSYVFGKVYIQNNEFPKYTNIIKEIMEKGFIIDENEIETSTEYIKNKLDGEKIFSNGYFEKVKYGSNVRPLLIVLQYLNSLSIEDLSPEELLFYNYYTVYGVNSAYKSSRGTEGKRNYFTADNAKKIGRIIETIKRWYLSSLISEMEFYILLCALIEEVTLNANVNGTFHDFNRSKLFPNALTPLKLKPMMLNISENAIADYCICKEDSNKLFKEENFNALINKYKESVLYIDPPYNFRQYSAYYHMLNFIAIYHTIDNPIEYANGFNYVRGQNMKNNFNSQYCYKDKFIDALEDLITNIKSKHIVISYYDENNHWNHGKKVISMDGRKEIVNMFSRIENIATYDEEAFTIPRVNYQSRSGEHKKQIDELIFYARR
ncbi:MAG: DNA adenine methylase [Beduini sp.]|uniref:DNA adenine methylase n=1 Tax=Beduini sp. TaxID=1922300 RepID=UPI0039A2F156